MTGRWAEGQLNPGTEVSVNSNSIVTVSVSIDTAKICSFVVAHALRPLAPEEKISGGGREYMMTPDARILI